jgi:hypothetical protein
MAWLVLREPLTGRLIAVTATAACGVLLVSGVVVDGGSVAADEYGTALILGGVLCCALHTVLSRRVASTVDPLLTIALQLTMGLVWAAVSALNLASGSAGLSITRIVTGWSPRRNWRDDYLRRPLIFRVLGKLGIYDRVQQSSAQFITTATCLPEFLKNI